MTAAMSEPHSTAVLIALFGVLLTVSVLATRALDRVGVPVSLLFLVIGMVGGSEGLGGLEFDDAGVAFRFGTVALVLILLDGGLNTRWGTLRTAALPAGLLATVGVAATATVAALAARWFGLPWTEATLVGAIVSSTDAAAVFGVLRGSGIRLENRLQSTLEVESCANDPMAVILTLAATEAMSRGEPIDAGIFAEVPLQLLIGAAVGLGCGYLFRLLINVIRLSATGLYPVFLVAAAFAAFGASTLMYGSGFLAVYLAAVVLGNGHLPFSEGLRRVHDAIAWLAQVLMFLMLGLLVFPSRLWPLAGIGIGVGLVLALVARPLAALLCLSWFGWRPREIGLVGWIGLRGAVPIILATFPVMQGLPGADRVFHVVFFVVVVSAVVPGASIALVALRTRLGWRVSPTNSTLELQHADRIDHDLHQFVIEAASPAAGRTLRDLALPDSAAVVLIVRGDQPLPARGSSQVRVGDMLYVVCDQNELAAVGRLLVEGSASAPA